MKLTKLIYKSIATELDNIGVTNYLYLAPDKDKNGNDIPYHFVTFYATGINVEYTFTDIIEMAHIQFTAFSNGATAAADVIELLATIEETFQEYEADDGDNHIFCAHHDNVIGPVFDGKENVWQGTIDFEFKCIRTK